MPGKDEFLSSEDLDLKNLSEEELEAYWNFWLLQAQVTNDLDQYLYSHGVFEIDPRASADYCQTGRTSKPARITEK